MQNKFTSAEKVEFVKRYKNGTPVTAICAEAGIAKSTFYSWIKPYSIVIAKTGEQLNLRDFNALQKRNEKLESIVKILKHVDCTVSSPLQEKLAVMEPLHGQFSGYLLSEALEVPRGTFYNHIFRRKGDNSVYAEKRRELRGLIQQVYDEGHQVLGPEKIRVILSEQGCAVSKKLVAELMKEMNLYSVRTTAKKDYHNLKNGGKKENILKRNFHTKAPNQVWVSDVTTFKLGDKYFYICIIIDLFSRKVIAYRTSLKNSTKLITTTFKTAFEQRKPEPTLVFHSDRGSQYTAFAFRKLLQNCNVEQSFSSSGKPCDNAVAESFFATLKKEELYRASYRSEAELRRHIDTYMSFYNSQRPHVALNYKTPERVEKDYWNRN